MKMRIGYAVAALAAVLFVGGAIGPMSSTRGRGPADVSVGTSESKAEDLASEALEYLQRSRDEAKPELVIRARDLLTRSLELQPKDNFAATLGMAALGNASHDFTGSVGWSKRAIQIDPYDSSPYGILGDALFELGRYRESDRAYQDMIDLKPDVASYVRASYSAQYRGRYDDALRAMELAIDAAPPNGEQAAWLRHQRGDIYASLGRFDRSERENRIGIELAPGYVPPTVGVAESLIARGRLEDALPLMESAAAELPALEYLVTLGDLYSATGDAERAEEMYAQASSKLEEYRSAGVLSDADFVLFYADHGQRLQAALAEARAIYSNRPTSATADVLAWALWANGRNQEALRYSDIALSTAQQPDALQHFHHGMIASGLSRQERAERSLARALELDPAFSLVHRDTALAILDRRATR